MIHSPYVPLLSLSLSLSFSLFCPALSLSLSERRSALASLSLSLSLSLSRSLSLSLSLSKVHTALPTPRLAPVRKATFLFGSVICVMASTHQSSHTHTHSLSLSLSLSPTIQGLPSLCHHYLALSLSLSPLLPVPLSPIRPCRVSSALPWSARRHARGANIDAAAGGRSVEAGMRISN